MRKFMPILTASVNRKGVLDVDTVKGCAAGMAAHPAVGCYGLCYAAKVARFYGYDFSISVSRHISAPDQTVFDYASPYGSNAVWRTVKHHALQWFRIGTMGDPCHDWPLTVEVCKWLSPLRTPIIISKYWHEAPGWALDAMRECGAVFNTSISALDDFNEIAYRIYQHKRAIAHGVKAVFRVVTCRFGDTAAGREKACMQRLILASGEYIDNPLRIPHNDPRVSRGDIIVERRADLGGGSTVSVNDGGAYIGTCAACPDQCGLYPQHKTGEAK